MANQEAQLVRSSSEMVVSEFDDNETNMEAFYASLESETASLSDVPLQTKPSQRTQKAIQTLQYLVTKNLSVLFLNNVHASMMKNALKYLLSLPPGEGFCMRKKSEMLQLLQSFTQLISNYCDADAKFDSATSELSKAAAATAKAKDLEANVREFREMDKEDKYLCNQLASLEEEKRELEEKINCIKIQIANSTARRERFGKRKIELFLEGSGMKEVRDHFRNQLPRLKAEKECAKLAQANFEVEWFKLREQFIQNTCFNVWI